MNKSRILPADVYDALELSAEAFGGIGAGSYYAFGSAVEPWCARGHAWFVDNNSDEAALALRRAGIREANSDAAVRRVNARKGGPRNARISFAEWCEKLNVVRGDA